MNDRIKQLLYETRIYDGLSGPTQGIMTCPKSLEEFAELIVRECSRVIVNGGYWSGGPLGPKRQCTPPEIAQMIRQHFGVEE